MTVLRKGQHLFNEIAKAHELQDRKVGLENLPYVNLHRILFYMGDEEFDEIMARIK